MKTDIDISIELLDYLQKNMEGRFSLNERRIILREVNTMLLEIVKYEVNQ